MLRAHVHVRALVHDAGVLGLGVATVSPLRDQVETIIFLVDQHRVRCHAFVVGEGAALSTRLNA